MGPRPLTHSQTQTQGEQESHSPPLPPHSNPGHLLRRVITLLSVHKTGKKKSDSLRDV